MTRQGRYGFAVAATAVALLITLALAPFLEDFTLLLLLAAVMASALHGGAGPGLVATALAVSASVLEFHLFSQPNVWAEVLRRAIFLLVAGGISLLSEARRRAERERDALLVREQNARAEAEAASWAKDEFLATVSHELRNPLAPILTWAGLLRRGAVDEGRRQYALEAIERNARVQARLVEDLLDVSRIVAGKLRVELRLLELAPVIGAAIETVRPSAEVKGIHLAVLVHSAGALVEGDPARLQQVAWNLLSNAIKFTPERGRVWVRLTRIRSHVVLEVGDTGRGIDPRLLPHVFERFWQAETGSSRQTGGLGLGLAIVRHLVELHGGTVSAHSRGVGEGATFRVMLPLLARSDASEGAAAPPAGEPWPGPAPRTLSGVSVLVVDDQPDMTEAVRALLGSCGAEVRVATSTPQALDVLDSWRPTVLVSDIAMPGEDGYALIRKVRAREPERGGDIPAVALTACARPEDRATVLAAGFQAHLSKASSQSELVSVLARLVGHH